MKIELACLPNNISTFDKINLRLVVAFIYTLQYVYMIFFFVQNVLHCTENPMLSRQVWETQQYQQLFLRNWKKVAQRIENTETKTAIIPA